MNTEQELTFDHADPAMKDRLHETYAEFRAKCPVAHGENFGGFWALTRYDDVLQAARDYKNFTVTKGITIPHINGATPCCRRRSTRRSTPATDVSCRSSSRRRR